ncbi:MAG: CNP1-like family protein [Gammaproteobacteria bacterium]|nr:CNP1-like family protein [Gammaproteobacteria bacterium]
MIPLLLPVLRCCRILCLGLLAALPFSVVAEILPEDGPVDLGPPKTYPSEQEWQELGSELPPWPELNSLIEMEIDPGGRGYRLYIDPQSLTTGKDRVVRFTSVMVSPSGVRNVTYEGLHCGEGSYRRLAYGMQETWHELPNSTWAPLVRDGAGGYRRTLYNHYMCIADEPNNDADTIRRRLRSGPPALDD